MVDYFRNNLNVLFYLFLFNSADFSVIYNEIQNRHFCSCLESVRFFNTFNATMRSFKFYKHYYTVNISFCFPLEKDNHTVLE